jgi:hypothetical protein
MTGHVPNRTKVVTRDEDAPEGGEPFRATIVTSLSFEEIDAIVIDGSLTFSDLFAAIAPFVVAWNATARNRETGTYEPVPPPGESGPQALRALEPATAIWLAMQIRSAPFLPPDPKESAPSGSTPGGPNEPGSDSPTPETSQPDPPAMSA